MTIAVVDYGAGNLRSVENGLKAVGADVHLTRTVAALDGAAGIVVPGVGHFAATAALDLTWRTALQAAIRRGVPVLGICLGMQWLFDGSEERPGLAGLGVLAGRCFRLAGPVKVPHVGWNTLAIGASSRLLRGLQPGSSAYFSHTYAAPRTAHCVSTTTHGVPFASAVECGNVFGVQFHPEKSGRLGLAVLASFLAITQGA